MTTLSLVDVSLGFDVGGATLVGGGVFVVVEWHFTFDGGSLVVDAASFDGFWETVVPCDF